MPFNFTPAVLFGATFLLACVGLASIVLAFAYGAGVLVGILA